MIEHDTVRLLRECDAGVKMGISSIDDVLSYVSDKDFKEELIDCKAEHERLGCEIRDRLAKFQDDGKEPNPMAKGMSRVKTNTMLTLNESDETIADLMTDGCNMGVKSLSRYLNKYEAAEEYSKDIAKKLINHEGQFAVDIRKYL